MATAMTIIRPIRANRPNPLAFIKFINCIPEPARTIASLTIKSVNHTFNPVRMVAGILISLAFSPTTVQAHTTPPPAYQLAAQQAGVPVAVLYAIALQESGMTLHGRRVPWPWSLNVAGQTQRFPNRAAACTALKQALQQVKPTQVDVGLAQINLGYQQHRYQNPCELLNPYRNLRIAAQILLEQHQPGQDWLTTAGRYHRPAGGEPAARYRAGVSQHLMRLQPVANQTTTMQAVQPAIPATAHPQAIQPPATAPSNPMPPGSTATNADATTVRTIPRLIVVEDHGGTSALPYYQTLNLPHRPSTGTSTTPQQ